LILDNKTQKNKENMLKVYLAGEINTNWREEIIENCKKENLDIQFSSPVKDNKLIVSKGLDNQQAA